MKTADPEQVVLFDGVCNLCNSAVQFIIRNDPHGRFKFCSLQSNCAERMLQSRDVDTNSQDTVILLQDGNLYVRSTAALKIARQLRAPWNLFALLLIVPRPIRDIVYRMIATNRHRLWKKRVSCMAPTPEMKARFLDSGEQPQTGIISGASV
jgi:predicted DCC family thiol-disulfide oxidoreductase YuxK